MKTIKNSLIDLPFLRLGASVNMQREIPARHSVIGFMERKRIFLSMFCVYLIRRFFLAAKDNIFPSINNDKGIYISLHPVQKVLAWE